MNKKVVGRVKNKEYIEPCVHETAKFATCLNCGERMAYTDNMMRIGFNGYLGVDCAHCGDFISISDKREVDPEYPTTFYSFDSGVKIDDKTINGWLNKTKEKMKELKPGEFSIIASGDSCVIGLKYADTEQYIVSKNYAEDEIWLIL